MTVCAFIIAFLSSAMATMPSGASTSAEASSSGRSSPQVAAVSTGALVPTEYRRLKSGQLVRVVPIAMRQQPSKGKKPPPRSKKYEMRQAAKRIPQQPSPQAGKYRKRMQSPQQQQQQHQQPMVVVSPRRVIEIPTQGGSIQRVSAGAPSQTFPRRQVRPPPENNTKPTGWHSLSLLEKTTI